MIEYFAGIDIGSTMTKVAVIEENVIATVLSATDPEHRKLANKVMEEALKRAGIEFEQIKYIVATGYGRINVPFADKQITEISCHAKGVTYFLPGARTIIDIGGQDSKGIKLNNGRVTEFVMNDKCAAGTGRFLEVIAEALGITLEEMGPLSLTSFNDISISNTCTVFAEQEVMNKLTEGVAIADLIAGTHRSIANRVYGMISRLKIERDVVITGGGAKNVGLVRAIESKLCLPVLIPPEPLLTGAIGAALLAKEEVKSGVHPVLPLRRNKSNLKETSFFS
jgi:(R)-2-hydroxyacyl-CoA dehydratese activating ATPase